VAWSNPDRGDAGYATGVALAISLSIGVVVTAVMGASVASLKRARGDLERTKVEYALAGAQVRAIDALVKSKQTGRLRWTLSSDVGGVEALAEPEAPKLKLADAANLDEGSLVKLGVRDTARARDRMRILSVSKTRAKAISEVDGAPLWRACARSLISPFGAATELSLADANEPSPGGVSWRMGEVWRLKVVTTSGWVEERVVRFTGDPDRPAAVVERQFYRGGEAGEKCSAFIDNRPKS
jgi:hypothetical protein